MPKPSSPSVKVSYPRHTREDLLAVLRGRLPELARRLPLVRVVLFGSWATGRHTAASDIDLLVVYQGEPREEAFRLVKTVLATPGLEPHVYAQGEAAAMQARLARMTVGGVVLFSTEEP